MYLLKGKLPWNEIKRYNNSEKRMKIMKMKESFDYEKIKEIFPC